MSDIKKTNDSGKTFSLDGEKGTDFVVGDIHGNFLDNLKNLPKEVSSNLTFGASIPTLTGKDQGKHTAQAMNDILAHEVPHEYRPKDVASVAKLINTLREEGFSPVGNHESLAIPKKK